MHGGGIEEHDITGVHLSFSEVWVLGEISV